MDATARDERIARQITRYYAVAGAAFTAIGIAMTLYLPAFIGILLLVVGILSLAVSLAVWRNHEALPPADRWWKLNMLKFWGNLFRGRRRDHT